MISTKLFREFFESEKSGGMILIACTLISLLLCNSGIGESYLSIWHLELAGHSLNHWINDGLMAVFFLLIGLELERELYIGELSQLKDAILPIFAAIGGMVVPALLYFYFNFGTVSQSGIGIPMATDIAFALGVLSLLGNRIPLSLKIFLTALAVMDDLGAILLIAVFYSKQLDLSYLCMSLAVFAILLLLNRLKMYRIWIYMIGGALMWYCMLRSGVHATITGVLLAFAIPFGNGNEESPSYRLQHWLHKPVAWLILPVFALANTAVVLHSEMMDGLKEPVALGIFAGLVFGKPLGIFLFSFIAVAIGMCKLPAELHWKAILGAGFLGGIGFTMSIFITLLAFEQDSLVQQSKLVILLSSLVAGITGYFLLKYVFQDAHVSISEVEE